jgi:hypothetical protein
MPKQPATTQDLAHEFGPVMDARALRRIFNYSTQSGLRGAISRGALPVRVFTMQGRRGPFALTSDVARWLEQVKQDGSEALGSNAAAGKKRPKQS